MPCKILPIFWVGAKLAEPRWKQYERFSGPVITGCAQVPAPTSLFTLERQHWLTTQVETGGTFGTVVMFDGTCVTAGPDQFILVYPAELAREDFNAADDQGLLGKLLARVFLCEGARKEVSELQAFFRKSGWYLSPIGELRYVEGQGVSLLGRRVLVQAGELVHGAVLRDVMTPLGGLVPKSGPQWEQSAAWCRLFADVFAHPATFLTQQAFGKERLVKAYKQPRIKTPTGPVSVESRVFGTDASAIQLPECGAALDLAMAIWYSNSVNAPAIALSVLSSALPARDARFPARLIRALGLSSYGRWNASIPAGRYQRTRRIAQASGLWPSEFFVGDGAIMPSTLT